jgi:LysR family hca operon transcriptional activator
MELRHLKYFVAVVEAGSLTVAAEQRLHTSQPSLSRQIRDLEQEVGVKLLTRSVTGVALTDAGRAFLDHARLALAQVEAAKESARRAAQPAKQTFAVGFLTGIEIEWLPAVTRVLRDELRTLEMSVTSDYSSDLADALMRGTLDCAILRVEPQFTDLKFVPVAQEPLVVLMPSDHPLAARAVVDPRSLAGESFIGGSKKAGVLPWSVVSRPLKGNAPTIDLAVGYSKSNSSPMLRLLLSKLDELRALAPAPG